MMKVKFMAKARAPDVYELDGETINGIDLSVIEHGGQFLGNDETQSSGIRDAWRDEHGVLHVVLCQRVIASQHPEGPAHWRESQWIDAESYDPEECYVVPTGLQHLARGVDYFVAWGKGIAPGEQGWTVLPQEPADE